MQRSATRLELLDTMLTEAAGRGLILQTAQDERLDGRHLRVDGKELLNFGSCSYLALELDPRVKHGAADALLRYGALFASSRAYISAPPYEQLEELFAEIFEAHVIVTPTTTLAHLSALPVLIEERDAMILDHQVHTSVQTACNQARSSGAHLELLKHSRIDLLEDRIRKLRGGHRHVWYLADGVYSMFGDFLPAEELLELLDRYPNFRLYVDDAHGMSWRGLHGRGYALSCIPLHPRMVLATGLGKGFGTGGGVLVFPDAEQRKRVRLCGGPMIFSGPLQPPVLGAAVASARIHLSEEIAERQQELRRRIRYCNELLQARSLPVVSPSESPVRYLGMGLLRVAENMTARLRREGFFTNLCGFPAVPMQRSGVRFTLTLHNDFEDIRSLVEAIDRQFEPAFAEEGEEPGRVWKAFGLAPPERPRKAPAARIRRRSSGMRVERFHCIDELPQPEWDRCFGNRGSFSVEGIRFLERTFSGNPEPFNNWRFHYYRVVDAQGRLRLATFFTEALWKADIFASGAIAREVDKERKNDPHFLTHRAFAMGSLLTEGNHLFVVPEVSAGGSSEWQEPVAQLLSAVREDADAARSNLVVLRDFPAESSPLGDFLRDRGFARMPVPDTMIAQLWWDTEDQLVDSLSRRARRHHRDNVIPWNDTYEIERLHAGSRRPSPEELQRCYSLYLNVVARSRELHTFELPTTFFQRVLESPGWELLLARPATGNDLSPSESVVAAMACFVGPEQYVTVAIGLDYRFVYSHGLYRQCLRHVLLRARELGLKRVHLGLGAALEKRRFGADPHATVIYVQADDHYAFDVVEQMSTGAALKQRRRGR